MTAQRRQRIRSRWLVQLALYTTDHCCHSLKCYAERALSLDRVAHRRRDLIEQMFGKLKTDVDTQTDAIDWRKNISPQLPSFQSSLRRFE